MVLTENNNADFVQSGSTWIHEDEGVCFKAYMMNPSDRKINFLLEEDLEIAHEGRISHPSYAVVQSQLVGTRIFHEHVVYLKKYYICLLVCISLPYVP